MIPKNITKAEILRAIKTIDADGIPKTRESTRYNLLYMNKLYPPKYVISLANNYTNGYELKPADFSGGEECNRFLRELGFEIADNNNNENCIEENLSPDMIRIATCCIESWDAFANKNRLHLLKQIIEEFFNKADLLLLPAGFFETRSNSKESKEMYVEYLQKELNNLKSDIVICYGVDGRNKTDQIGLAVSKKGLIGAGRKFYPTKEEVSYIDLAHSYVSKEISHERIFKVKEKNFYIAVCYDGFGLRKMGLKNPGVDIILNLVHGFNPVGEFGSGEVYFTKHSFAGASKQWGCPTFGAAVFERREIPLNWPTGVLWNQGEKSTQKWKYTENAISPICDEYIQGKHEGALIRTFIL